MEQENQSCISSFQYLEEEVMKLKVERQEKENLVSILLKKSNRIQNFDRVVVRLLTYLILSYQPFMFIHHILRSCYLNHPKHVTSCFAQLKI